MTAPRTTGALTRSRRRAGSYSANRAAWSGRPGATPPAQNCRGSSSRCCPGSVPPGRRRRSGSSCRSSDRARRRRLELAVREPRGAAPRNQPRALSWPAPRRAALSERAGLATSRPPEIPVHLFDGDRAPLVPCVIWRPGPSCRRRVTYCRPCRRRRARSVSQRELASPGGAGHRRGRGRTTSRCPW